MAEPFTISDSGYFTLEFRFQVSPPQTEEAALAASERGAYLQHPPSTSTLCECYALQLCHKASTFFDSIPRAVLPSTPQRLAVEEEIASLLNKEAIMTVPQPEAQRGFVSRVWCFKVIYSIMSEEMRHCIQKKFQ